MDKWFILMVDDDADIHTVTRLALKYKSFKDKRFDITSCMSAGEARALLEKPDCPAFHAALVDVVMETDDAGLKLCDYIRKSCPSTIRTVLRTGQPGSAPAEVVMKQHGIDFYITKPEATDERLFEMLCQAIGDRA